ncbi:hypothetical protein EG857_14865, partial [Enterococcus faecalis]
MRTSVRAARANPQTSISQERQLTASALRGPDMAADAGERRGATEEDGGAFASSVSLARMLYGCDLPAVVRSRWPGVSLDLQRDAPVELPSP